MAQITTESVRESLLRFLGTLIVSEREEDRPTASTPLLSGLLDSIAILRLAVFIEEQFQVHVEDHELVPENFQTAEQIANYVARKRNKTP